MSIEAAIANLQAITGAVPGIKSAPAAPPESANQFPFAVAYERSGELSNLIGGQMADNKAVIYIEVHVARQLLPQAITLAMSLRDPLIKAIVADPTLGGTVLFVSGLRLTFGGMKWAGIDTFGYRFELDCTVRMVLP